MILQGRYHHHDFWVEGDALSIMNPTIVNTLEIHGDDREVLIINLEMNGQKSRVLDRKQ